MSITIFYQFFIDLFSRRWAGTFLLLITSALFSAPLISAQRESPLLRGDIATYLDFLRDEQIELDFQLAHQEITRPAYLRAKSRITILKSLAIAYSQSKNPDPLPDYHVVTKEQLDTMIPNGSQRIRRIKNRAVIDGRWRFLKIVPGRETFYVLERLDQTSKLGGAG